MSPTRLYSSFSEPFSFGSDGDSPDVDHNHRATPSDPIVELKKALAEKVGVPLAKRAWTIVYPTETDYPTLSDKAAFDTSLKVLVDTANGIPDDEEAENG